jgi:type II secretory ATPase GspE/PulE/Tfp pilus assembly ATPase PilB-like protein
MVRSGRLPRAAIAQEGPIGAQGGDLEAYESVGCAQCNHSGYRGRVGLYSVMKVSERIKEMIIDEASESEITAVAHKEGMRTLREDGIVKVRSGQISVEEVLRVTA